MEDQYRVARLLWALTDDALGHFDCLPPPLDPLFTCQLATITAHSSLAVHGSTCHTDSFVVVYDVDATCTNPGLASGISGPQPDLFRGFVPFEPLFVLSRSVLVYC